MRRFNHHIWKKLNYQKPTHDFFAGYHKMYVFFD